MKFNRMQDSHKVVLSSYFVVSPLSFLDLISFAAKMGLGRTCPLQGMIAVRVRLVQEMSPSASQKWDLIHRMSQDVARSLISLFAFVMSTNHLLRLKQYTEMLHSSQE